MKSTSIILAIVASISLSGCGFFDRYVTANITGHSESCVGGVSYLQFASGVTVKYTPDGKIATCK